MEQGKGGKSNERHGSCNFCWRGAVIETILQHSCYSKDLSGIQMTTLCTFRITFFCALVPLLSTICCKGDDSILCYNSIFLLCEMKVVVMLGFWSSYAGNRTSTSIFE